MSGILYEQKMNLTEELDLQEVDEMLQLRDCAYKCSKMMKIQQNLNIK